MRRRDRNFGKGLRQRLSHPRLVVRPHVRKEEIQRKREIRRLNIRIRQTLPNRIDQALDALGRQRCDGLAAIVDPLSDSQAISPRHQRQRTFPVQVVVELAIHALQEGHVLEAFGRYVKHSRPAPLQQRVDRDGGAQHQVCRAGRIDACLFQRRQDRPARFVRRGRQLDHVDMPRGLVHHDQVGERAPGIDPDPYTHAALSSAGCA